MISGCRRHLVQSFFRRSSVSRSVCTSLARPLCTNFIRPNDFSRHTPAARRYTSTTKTESVTKQSVIKPEEYAQLIDRAGKSWPPPPFVPPGWSCTWSDWDNMTTYYWFSPYFLMLPQIEMHVNIQYGIRGDTRPVLFSNERQAFVFAILGSNNYFFFDGPSSLLYRVKDVQSDRQLVELLAKGDEAFAAKLEVVQENQQGKALISRILSRDESVIPILAQKFLDYTPTPTTPWMEMDTFEVSPEMEAEYDEISKQNLIEQEHALRFDEALEDGDEIRLDKELQDVEKEIEELQDFVNSISGLKKVDKQQLGELAQRKEQILEKWERRGAVPDEHDETDGEVPDAQLENHTEEAENLKVEIDVPPKMVKGMKVKYLTLTKNIDELLEEMEHINVPSNHEVFADYVDNYRLLRRAMSRLELRSALEVGDYLAHKLTEFKTNPEVITRLKKLTNDQGMSRSN